MVMYQQDPIAAGQIRVLEKALSESEQKRYELERKVFDLNSQIEKITGYGPEYVRHLTTQYKSSLSDARQSLIAAQNEHRQQLEKLDAQIRRELDRYLTATKMADVASGQAEKLETARASLTSDVVAIVRKALEDNNPLILQPTVQGVGVDLVKLFKWARSKLARRRASTRP